MINDAARQKSVPPPSLPGSEANPAGRGEAARGEAAKRPESTQGRGGRGCAGPIPFCAGARRARTSGESASRDGGDEGGRTLRAKRGGAERHRREPPPTARGITPERTGKGGGRALSGAPPCVA
jgi:hypothetical protein